MLHEKIKTWQTSNWCYQIHEQWNNLRIGFTRIKLRIKTFLHVLLTIMLSVILLLVMLLYVYIYLYISINIWCIVLIQHALLFLTITTGTTCCIKITHIVYAYLNRDLSTLGILGIWALCDTLDPTFFFH